MTCVNALKLFLIGLPCNKNLCWPPELEFFGIAPFAYTVSRLVREGGTQIESKRA